MLNIVTVDLLYLCSLGFGAVSLFMLVGVRVSSCPLLVVLQPFL